MAESRQSPVITPIAMLGTAALQKNDTTRTRQFRDATTSQAMGRMTETTGYWTRGISQPMPSRTSTASAAR